MMKSRKIKRSAALITFLALTTLGSTSSLAIGSVAPRLNGTCSAELQWASIPMSMKNIVGQLICLTTPKGLKWQDPSKIKVDAHLNSILMKCGNQIQHLSVAKIDPKLLSTFHLALSQYVSTQLHSRVVRFEPSFGFYNLNVNYYRQIGMCSNGAGIAPYFTGPDPRIPENSELLWESVAYCQIGPQSVPLNFAFARAGKLWKFVALGGINSQPVYL